MKSRELTLEANMEDEFWQKVGIQKPHVLDADTTDNIQIFLCDLRDWDSVYIRQPFFQAILAAYHNKAQDEWIVLSNEFKCYTWFNGTLLHATFYKGYDLVAENIEKELATLFESVERE